MTQKNIRTRFAPSPTGFLHVGGLRTALYNYLLAKKFNGSFLLRIEDTDQTRKVDGAVENIIKTLSWAGLIYDEGPGKPGVCETYVQSERLPIYRKHAQQLIEQGNAYYCFCTQERLEQIKESHDPSLNSGRTVDGHDSSKDAGHVNHSLGLVGRTGEDNDYTKSSGHSFGTGYDRHCRDLSKEEVDKNLATGQSYVIRMKVPLEGQITIHDLIKGEVVIDYKFVDDQVLIKSDGFPTYHMAVVVDDHEMQISHVIRGDEWLPSTPKHLLLYKYFGWQAPEFAHLPLLLNPDRSKLSKRQGDVAAEDYRAKGYLPDALVNFIALLGWNPGDGDEREVFTMQQLIDEFSIERVGSSGAVFNVEKLQWLNGVYIREKSAQDIKEYMQEDLNFDFQESFKNWDSAKILRLIDLYKERVKTLQELIDSLNLLYSGPCACQQDKIQDNSASAFGVKSFGYDQEAITAWVTSDTRNYVAALIELLQKQEDFTHDNLVSVIKALSKELGIKLVLLAQPIRISLIGTSASPGIFDLLEILGKTESINRLNKFGEFISKN